VAIYRIYHSISLECISKCTKCIKDQQIHFNFIGVFLLLLWLTTCFGPSCGHLLGDFVDNKNTAVLFLLTSALDGMGGPRHASVILSSPPPPKAQIPPVKGAEGAPGPFWTGAEKLVPPGFDPRRNEYHEYFLGDKGGRCVGMTTLPP